MKSAALTLLALTSSLSAVASVPPSNPFPAPCETAIFVQDQTKLPAGSFYLNDGAYEGVIYAWGQGPNGIERSAIFTTTQVASTPSNPQVLCYKTRSSDEEGACNVAKQAAQAAVNTRMMELKSIGVCR